MSVPTPRAEAFMPMVAPSPPELPPAVRAELYGQRVVPRYEQVSRCINDWGLVVSAVSNVSGYCTSIVWMGYTADARLRLVRTVRG